MKIKTSELIGRALDWAVATAEGLKPEDIYICWSGLYRRLRDENGKLNGRYQTGPDLLFHRKWEAAGPIIARERINLDQFRGHPVRAYVGTPVKYEHAYFAKEGEPLVAAMRCYVSSKLGDEVEIPEELS